jgi:hypothetical protein
MSAGVKAKAQTKWRTLYVANSSLSVCTALGACQPGARLKENECSSRGVTRLDVRHVEHEHGRLLTPRRLAGVRRRDAVQLELPQALCAMLSTRSVPQPSIDAHP